VVGDSLHQEKEGKRKHRSGESSLSLHLIFCVSSFSPSPPHPHSLRPERSGGRRRRLKDEQQERRRRRKGENDSPVVMFRSSFSVCEAGKRTIGYAGSSLFLLPRKRNMYRSTTTDLGLLMGRGLRIEDTYNIHTHTHTKNW